MKFEPSYEEIQRLAETGQYQTAPVKAELLSDSKTPVEVLRILKNVSSHCYLLESAAQDETWGRYTFLGYDPKQEICCVDGIMKVDGVEMKTDHPEDIIRQILAAHKSPRIEGFPTFTGGLVGYFGYDYLKYSEPILKQGTTKAGSEDFQDVDLMLFDKVIAFDNYRQKLILIANVDLNEAETGYNRAKLEIEQMAQLIRTGQQSQNIQGEMKGEMQPLFQKEEYCEMVRNAKKYILEGDIFQIVLSNRLEAPYEGSLLNAYRCLRTLNPSPYMFYMSSDQIEVAGASPETLVKLENGVLHTFPLAGTRPRGKTAEEDKALEEELLADPKEMAEHNMLVDLGRNDLGRVSRFGSVKVEKYHVIEHYSHVMHIGSTIGSILREDADALDAISAVLPAGTLSGAPKIRACQLISDLEKNRRGIYGGAIGYLDFTGNMDTCIAIRIAYKKNDRVYVRSGAGIVADSVPEKEFQECLNKAAAVVKALKEAQEVEA